MRSTVILMGALLTASTAHAQVATFSGFDDAAPGCYQATGTAPDAIDPNLLRIGMGVCTASAPDGSAIVSDSFELLVTAPDGYFVSRITFTQSGTSSGSRGGAGFMAAMWTIDNTPMAVNPAADGWSSSVDLSLQRKTAVPVAVSTFLAAFGIQVVSGSASASNPAVLVELAPQ